MLKNRLASRPNGPRQSSPAKIPQVVPLVTNTLNGGINSEFDKADISDAELQSATNTSITLDKTSRRPGSTLLSTKYDSNGIVTIKAFRLFNGNIRLTRFTSTGLQWNNSGAWVPVTGTALTGASLDRFKTVAINDQYYFSNNGVDAIQKIDFTTNTYAPAGNAGKYKYIIGFHNRIVGAYDTGAGNPIQIAWSGILNFTEWNPVNDISAGSQPLIESATDYTDSITGLFSFGAQAAILRENSLWLANKQATTAQPFYFYCAVPSIGCDCPDSVCQIPGGLIWYNNRLGNVYTYTTDNAYRSSLPSPLATKLRTEMQRACKGSIYTQGSFNTYKNEYSLSFYDPTSTVIRVYVFNLLNSSWTYREYLNTSCIEDAEFTTFSGIISTLSGSISGLLGSISGLSAAQNYNIRLFGLTSGDILYEDPSVDTDNGTTYLTQIASKIFQLPIDNQDVVKLDIEYIASKAGAFILEYSRDGGHTFSTYRTVSFSATNGVPTLATCKLNVRARSYTWRLSASTGLFDITKYAIYVTRAGEENSGA